MVCQSNMTWLHSDTTLFLSATLRSPPATQPNYPEDEAQVPLSPEKLQAGERLTSNPFHESWSSRQTGKGTGPLVLGKVLEGRRVLSRLSTCSS